MALASVLSVTAHLGVFGPMAQAFSALIALATALISSPLMAMATRGKYYLARQTDTVPTADAGTYPRLRLQRCVICERDYEAPDMAHCPAYQGPICSLCCTLDARCGDLCKPHASLATQWSAMLRWLLPRRTWALLDKGLAYFLLLMLVIAPLLGGVFGLLYRQETGALAQSVFDASLLQTGQEALRSGFVKAYMALLLIAGLVAWWGVLAHQSRRVAQDESNRQTRLLLREIELHRQTDAALQLAKQAAERANQAKSRYISAISHELRTPLNSILGYAQLMGQDTGIPAHRKQAVAVIKRGGEHLLSLIEGTLDLAHIEAGRLTLNPRPLAFADFMQDLADMFALEAERKALRFVFEVQGSLPAMVRADEKRVRQILLNLLGNAIKFTASGQVVLRLRYAVEMAHIEVEDTGPGLSAQDLTHVFEPFARASAAGLGAPGAGMGLTIARMLTDSDGRRTQRQQPAGRGLGVQGQALPARTARQFADHRGRCRPAEPARRRSNRVWAMSGRASGCWWWTTKRPTGNCWCNCCTPWASRCAPPPAATTRWTCWPAATSPMPCSWTWRCPASTAGKPCAACGCSNKPRNAPPRMLRLSPPMLLTGGWTTRSACRVTTFSANRCVTLICWTGWPSVWGWHGRRPPNLRRHRPWPGSPQCWFTRTGPNWPPCGRWSRWAFTAAS